MILTVGLEMPIIFNCYYHHFAINMASLPPRSIQVIVLQPSLYTAKLKTLRNNVFLTIRKK